jgi:hypothetical protein
MARKAQNAAAAETNAAAAADNAAAAATDYDSAQYVQATVIDMLVAVSENKVAMDANEKTLKGLIPKIPKLSTALSLINSAIDRAYGLQEETAYLDEKGNTCYKTRHVKFCTLRACTMLVQWHKEVEKKEVKVKAKFVGNKTYKFEITEKEKEEAQSAPSEVSEEEKARRAELAAADTFSGKVLALFNVARSMGIPADMVDTWAADIDQWQAVENQRKAAEAQAAAVAAAAQAARAAENAAEEARVAAEKAANTRNRKTRDAAAAATQGELIG